MIAHLAYIARGNLYYSLCIWIKEVRKNNQSFDDLVLFPSIACRRVVV